MIPNLQSPLSQCSRKRQRVHALSHLTLLTLPLELKHCIIHQLCFSKDLLQYYTTPPLDRQFEIVCALRETCIAFRDAVDSYFEVVRLNDLEVHQIIPLLRLLPRFRKMRELSVTPESLKLELLPLWVRVLAERATGIKHLSFEKQYEAEDVNYRIISSKIVTMLIESLRPFLRSLQVFFPFETILRKLRRNEVSVMFLSMRSTDARLLQSCAPKELYLHYDRGLDTSQLMSLVFALRVMPHPPMLVMEMYHMRSVNYACFSLLRGLKHLALRFGPQEVDVAHSEDLGAIGNCADLSEAIFVGVGALNDANLETIAMGLLGRLKSLSVLRCDNVGIEGLRGLARWCPNVAINVAPEADFDPFKEELQNCFGDRLKFLY